MDKISSPIPPNQKRETESKLRAKIVKLLRDDGILHATLAPRLRVCGKPNCKCASGEKHESLYLVMRRDGQTRQIFVHPDWHETIRQWVTNYQVVQQMLDELSELSLGKLQDKEL